MTLDFSPASALGLANQIRIIEDLVKGTLQHALNSEIGASYSQVPGLDQLGHSHAQVLAGGAGSAADVLGCYKQHVGWLSAALSASIDALTQQESCNARAMDIADEGGSIATETIAFPPRPALSFQPFSFAVPAVGSAASLAQLAAAFAGTDFGAIQRASQAWHTMSGEIADAVTRLAGIADELMTLNSGEVFQKAAEIIGTVVQAGRDFSSNAATMAATLNQVDAVASWGAAQVAGAQASCQAIQDPALRKAAEQEFLTSFMGAEFPAALEAGVPPIAGLMDSAQTTAANWHSAMDSAAGGGGGGGAGGGAPAIDVGFRNVAGSGTPVSIQDVLRIGSAGPPLAAGGQPVTIGSTLGVIGQVVDGIHKLIGGVGTQQAGMGAEVLAPAAPNMSPLPSLPGGYTLGAHSATPFESMAAVPVPGQQASGRSASTGVAAPAPYGKHAAPSVPVTGTTTPSGGASPPLPMSGAMGAPFMGAWNKRAQGAPIGMSGNPPNSGGGAGGGGLPGFGGGSGMPVAGSASAPQQSGAKGVRGGFMGGMPMAGAGQHGQPQQRKARGKSSSFERDKNINDLIGELKPVLDGPIGAWVREPR